MNKHEAERDRQAEFIATELARTLARDGGTSPVASKAIANIAKKAFCAGWDNAIIEVTDVEELE